MTNILAVTEHLEAAAGALTNDFASADEMNQIDEEIVSAVKAMANIQSTSMRDVSAKIHALNRFLETYPEDIDDPEYLLMVSIVRDFIRLYSHDVVR